MKSVSSLQVQDMLNRDAGDLKRLCNYKCVGPMNLSTCMIHNSDVTWASRRLMDFSFRGSVRLKEFPYHDVIMYVTWTWKYFLPVGHSLQFALMFDDTKGLLHSMQRPPLFVVPGGHTSGPEWEEEYAAQIAHNIMMTSSLHELSTTSILRSVSLKWKSTASF